MEIVIFSKQGLDHRFCRELVAVWTALGCGHKGQKPNGFFPHLGWEREPFGHQPPSPITFKIKQPQWYIEWYSNHNSTTISGCS